MNDARPTQIKKMQHPLDRVAGFLSLGYAVLCGWLFFRWVTFGAFNWTPYEFELELSNFPGFVSYVAYLSGIILGGVGVVGLRIQSRWVRMSGYALALLGVFGGLAFYRATGNFYVACTIIGMSGLLLVVLGRHSAWAINFPAAYWLAVFFVAPMVIVLTVSLGERTVRGTIEYPAFSLTNLGVYFDDYVRFFSSINGRFLYLEIFWRSVFLAALNTGICLLFGFPFAYWIARRPQKYRNSLVLLVMIPFWTNFLVRTYAWMLILRDSGLINNFWTITLHEQAVALSGQNAFFAWLAAITANKLPLLFNQPAVFLGMFYGFFPFVVLPIYSNLEKFDWTLLEAAADLGANTWQRMTRILLPVSMPGIVAASIIVFIPSLGAYVTPDLLGGGKVVLLGNLLQQQFMTARDWPFGAAIGFIMMALMLLAIVLYFRVEGEQEPGA